MRVRIMVAGAVIGTALGVTVSAARRWRETWGIKADETVKPLPGDEVVTMPVASETRGITIDATPDQVWPWLVQMGFGRAGWYSYDQLDQRGRSADDLNEAWQTLAVGDIMPTHPGGGFEVVALEAGRSLVLRSDTALVKAQAEAAEASARDGTTAFEAAPAGLQASGAILGSTPQQFAASWAFVLEPIDPGQTRLIERFRVWYGESGFGAHVVMPVVGFGVFVMLQKQMLGIKARAERAARERAGSSAPAFPGTATTAGELGSPVRSGRAKRAEEPELATATVG